MIFSYPFISFVPQLSHRAYLLHSYLRVGRYSEFKCRYIKENMESYTGRLKPRERRSVGSDKLQRAVHEVKRKIELTMAVDLPTPRNTPKRPRRQSSSDMEIERYVK